jgi:hypothetical protein
MKYRDIAIIEAASPPRRRPRCWDVPKIPTILIDPHPTYPPDLRAEKLAIFPARPPQTAAHG